MNKLNFGAFLIGLILGSAAIGWSWKDVVTSGDYFSIGSQVYGCEKFKLNPVKYQ